MRKDALVILTLSLTGISAAQDERKSLTQNGIASWYWEDTHTASGEIFDGKRLTAAHRTLPMNTMVRVTNKLNGRCVTVRINDRGPYARATKKTTVREVVKLGRKHRTIQSNRIIDLSTRAAQEIGMTSLGLVPVEVKVLTYKDVWNDLSDKFNIIPRVYEDWKESRVLAASGSNGSPTTQRSK